MNMISFNPWIYRESTKWQSLRLVMGILQLINFLGTHKLHSCEELR